MDHTTIHHDPLVDEEEGKRRKSSLASIVSMFDDLKRPEYLKLKFDKDTWFKLPLKNKVLFDSLTLKGVPELLPGKLFSTRIPRNLYTNPNMAKKFTAKVKKYGLDTVCILVEEHEYKEYAEANVEDFYSALGLNTICHPIIDFGTPKPEEFEASIREVTKVLASGKNVLVHCAGGNGRTGMLLCGVLKNAGLDDPVRCARRIKSTYVETPEQEEFVAKLPITLDQSLLTEYPLLSRAIVMDKLLDAVAPKNKSSKDIALSEEQKKSYELAFKSLDADGDGQITKEELLQVCSLLGQKRRKKVVTKIINELDKDGDGQISFDEFLQGTAVVTV